MANYDFKFIIKIIVIKYNFKFKFKVIINNYDFEYFFKKKVECAQIYSSH